MITVYAEAERKRADEQSSTGRKRLAKILSLDAKPWSLPDWEMTRVTRWPTTFPAKAWALWLGDSPATRATYSPRYAYAANMPETAYLSEINDKYEYRGNLGKPRLVPWREQLQRVNHSESSYLWSRTDFGITTAPQATRQISASKRTPPKPRTSKLLSRESLLSWFTWGSPSSYSVIPVR